VRGLLEREGLKGVLSVENELVGEIRGLDGERKALVYDNYSKLIAATDTIRKVTSQEPGKYRWHS
jgi:YD repeat-containing protein